MPQERKGEERRFALRLPAELYEEVQASAERDTRSMNAEIIVLLREALAARKIKTLYDDGPEISG